MANPDDFAGPIQPTYDPKDEILNQEECDQLLDAVSEKSPTIGKRYKLIKTFMISKYTPIDVGTILVETEKHPGNTKRHTLSAEGGRYILFLDDNQIEEYTVGIEEMAEMMFATPIEPEAKTQKDRQTPTQEKMTQLIDMVTKIAKEPTYEERLRDEFAGQTLITAYKDDPRERDNTEMAKWCYAMADAMMEVRKK